MVIATAEANSEEDTTLTVTVQFTLTSEYPDEGPAFEVLSYDGFPDDDHINKIIFLIKEQVNFFTLALGLFINLCPQYMLCIVILFTQ